MNDKVIHQQHRQKLQHDRTTLQRTIRQDELVMVRGFHKGPKDICLPGSVVSINGDHSYKIKLSDGKIVQTYAGHIRPRQSDCIPVSEDDADDIPIPASCKCSYRTLPFIEVS